MLCVHPYRQMYCTLGVNYAYTTVRTPNLVLRVHVPQFTWNFPSVAMPTEPKHHSDNSSISSIPFITKAPGQSLYGAAWQSLTDVSRAGVRISAPGCSICAGSLGSEPSDSCHVLHGGADSSHHKPAAQTGHYKSLKGTSKRHEQCQARARNAL